MLALWQFTGFESGLLYLALAVFAGATIVGTRIVRGVGRGRGLRTMFLVGSAALTLLMAARALREGTLPVAHRSEILLVTACALSVVVFLVQHRRRAPVILAVAAPTVGLLVFFSLLLVPRGGGEDLPSLRLGQMVHISLAILGLAAFTFAAGVAAYYLWQIRAVKRNPSVALSRGLPALEVLDRINFLAVAFGFSFFSLSVLGGWLFVARSPDPLRWWLDPTVLASMAGLLVYLLLFLSRAFFGWRGRRVAWVTLTGFLVLVVGFVVSAFCTSPSVMHGS